MKSLFHPLLLAPLLFAGPARAADTDLAAYTRCPFEGQLTAVSIDRAAGVATPRTVDTASGNRAVSVADGYRVLLAFPATRPFVNLKVERSVTGQYAIDKQTVLDQMQYMADRTPAHTIALMRRTQNGIDVAALDNPALTSAVISFYTLFDDAHGIIATAYLLNQAPEQRAFKTIDEYGAMRDRFVRNMTACMARLGGG